jgi:hypothetical protein
VRGVLCRSAERQMTQIKWTREPMGLAKAFRCPCCRFKTLHGRGRDEICPVCFWHDDGQDERDAEVVLGGPNRDLSLRQAQENFQKIGAFHESVLRYVRKPNEDEPAYVFLSYVTYQRLLGPTLRQMVAMPGGDDIEFDPPRLSDDILRVPD